MTLIPYKGAGQVPVALMSGQISAASLTDADLSRLHRSGKARVLATTGPVRSVILPDIPTFKELGVNWVDGAFRGIGMPKSTPP